METPKEMINMLMEQAATVRKEWSTVCDSVIHEKPKFIKPIRDELWLLPYTIYAVPVPTFCLL